MKKVFDFIIGNNEGFSLEGTYILVVSFLGFLALFLGIFIYLFAPSSFLKLSIVSGVLSFSFGFAYYRARFLKRFDYTYEISMFSMLIFFNFAWFLSGGLKSPNILIPVILVTFTTIIKRNFERYFLNSIIIINFFIVVILEYLKPFVVIPYSSRSGLFFDNLTTYVLTFVIGWVAIKNMMNNYNYKKKILLHVKKELKQRKTTLIKKNKELKATLNQIEKLSGFVPICPVCKKIKDDSGYWKEIELYFQDKSEAAFSHGLCPSCFKELYPDFYKEKTNEK